MSLGKELDGAEARSTESMQKQLITAYEHATIYWTDRDQALVLSILFEATMMGQRPENGLAVVSLVRNILWRFYRLISSRNKF